MSLFSKKSLLKISLYAICGLSVSLASAGKKENINKWLEGDRNCESLQPAPRFDGSFCESLFYLRPLVVPLNTPAQIIQNQQVVFLGDTHPNAGIKKWTARNLKEFKSRGFTHIALEALNSESQNQVEAYLNNPRLRLQIIKLIADDWGWIPEAHVQLIDAIHAAGLKVLAIDNRNELIRSGHENDIRLRNIHMAQEIANALNEPDAGKILVLTGKVHSALISDEANIKTLPEILKSQGIDNLSYDVETGEQPVPRTTTQAFFFELKQNKLEKSTNGDYFLPTTNKNSVIDGLIFVSQ